MKLNFRCQDYETSYPQQLMLKIIADDESREASMGQRVRKLENNLFDEYRDELCAFKVRLLHANEICRLSAI